MIWFLTVFTVMCAFALQASAQPACKVSNSYQDLVACAEARSPEVQSAQLELDRSKAQVQAAGQWRNPELSAETFQGSAAGEKRAETDIALGIPVELGGKISARTAVAEGGVSVAEAKLFEARTNVRAQVLLKLHRLRQVIHEQEIAEEAIRTFSKLVGQYVKRPNLSPEQQISLSVFQLSKSEYELKKSSTQDEIAALNSFFRLNLGLNADEIMPALPKSPKNWPKLNTPSDGRISTKQRVLQAELKTAQAELSVARSEAWPTLMVGPSLKVQTESGQTNNLMGFNVSLPLPLFNVNGGAKAAAAASVKLSETRRQLGLQEQSFKREELNNVYEQALKVLSESISHEEIEKRHANADRLFTKGVVPSALVIEAHRTSFELEKTRHERELKALEALLEISAIDGTILEVNL